MDHDRRADEHLSTAYICKRRPMLCRSITLDRVKPLFVSFDIRGLWRSALVVRVPGCQKLQMTA